MELTREIRDRRVAVMRDVVDRLDGEQPYRMRQGVYVRGRTDLDIEKSTGGVFAEIASKECECCFLSAAFLSWLKIEGSGVSCKSFLLSGGGIRVSGHTVKGHLGCLFDVEAMGLMESAFEQILSCARIAGASWDDAENAADFWEIIDSDDPHDHLHDLARAIAQNVIDHDGEFVP